QRIVRQVCPHCKELYEPSPEIVTAIKTVLGNVLPKAFATGQPIRLARGKGCDECNQSGYMGRIGIFEILRGSPAVNKLVMSEASSQEIEMQARNEGMVLMKQDGYLKALAGLTTIDEVMRVTEA
ncbi:MAG TPA: type II secretion system protein GspE, partial [Candidatus Woesebacteria bacterium]|nr:type II secretion system protein GspE [Candidatus Woesebacteria bacterium]